MNNTTAQNLNPETHRCDRCGRKDVGEQVPYGQAVRNYNRSISRSRWLCHTCIEERQSNRGGHFKTCKGRDEGGDPGPSFYDFPKDGRV